MMRFKPDPFFLYLLCAIVLASFLPVHGAAKPMMSWVSNLAIALLFFLHGARLSREAIISGATHWQLHSLIFSTTFVIFPILGIVLRPILEPMVTPDLYMGFLYLCCLPATVQSAISFTSIARGNLATAVCSASASSILGIIITPLLVGLLLSEFSQSIPPFSLEALGKITLQLLVPFLLGHISRPWLGEFILKNKALLKFVDQGVIILVVYSAFSEAVIEGLWSKTPSIALVGILAITLILLSVVLSLTWFGGAILGFNLPDRITLMFCGSKKSLATGLPMAKVIFAGHTIGAIILPLMIFHQIQLMICAVIASRLAKRPEHSSNPT